MSFSITAGIVKHAVTGCFLAWAFLLPVRCGLLLVYTNTKNCPTCMPFVETSLPSDAEALHLEQPLLAVPSATDKSTPLNEQGRTHQGDHVFRAHARRHVSKFEPWPKDASNIENSVLRLVARDFRVWKEFRLARQVQKCRRKCPIPELASYRHRSVRTCTCSPCCHFTFLYVRLLSGLQLSRGH